MTSTARIPRTSRLPSRAVRKSLTLGHVVASVGLLGASCSSLLLALTGAVTSDGQLADDAYRLVALQSAVFGIPLSGVALSTGVALGLSTKWGILRYRWTTAKLALLLLTMVNGGAVIGPATEALRDGGGAPWLLVAALGVTVTMLATATGLSVFKPGGRRRARAGG
jgi:hypothetical protein